MIVWVLVTVHQFIDSQDLWVMCFLLGQLFCHYRKERDFFRADFSWYKELHYWLKSLEQLLGQLLREAFAILEVPQLIELWGVLLNGDLTYYSPVLLNSLSANFTKWSDTLKQFVGNLPTNCLSVFDYFVGLALKGLMFSGVIDKQD